MSFQSRPLKIYKILMPYLETLKEQIEPLLKKILEHDFEFKQSIDFIGYYTPIKGPYVGQALPINLIITGIYNKNLKGEISITNLFENTKTEFFISNNDKKLLFKPILKSEIKENFINYCIEIDLKSLRLFLRHHPPSLKLNGTLKMNEDILGEIVLYAPLAQFSFLLDN